MTWRNWQGDTIIEAVKQASFDALNKALEGVGAVSDSQVPLDEGPLKASKTIKIRMSNNPKGSISYGGGKGTGKPRIPYALRWHNQQANFQHGRKRFYLRDPFNKFMPDLLKAALVEKIGRAL